MVIFSRLIVAVLLLLGVVLQQAAAEVSVTVDRNPVQVNESFQLVFSLDRSPDRDPDFSALQQYFIILDNSRNSSISIINGEYRRSVEWSLQLMAKQIGEFMIPAIHFGQDRSKPFQVTVKPSSMSSQPHDQLLLEMLPDTTRSRVQSQVILTLRLLSATDISAYQFGDLSITNLDVVIEPLGDVRQYQTRIADRRYLVLEKRLALFPQQSGRLDIGPLLAEVRLPSRKSFDPFQRGGKIHSLRSQPVSIEVEPIPADYRASYWLPATRLELRESWQGDPDDIVAGEPLTRSLTLIAQGLTAAQLPELPLAAIDGVKQYPDQPELNNGRTHDGITGRRVQKVALIPGAAGRYRVPEIRLPWWNLQTGQVEYATVPGRELIVKPAAAAETPTPERPRSVTPVAPAVPAEVLETNRFWLWLSLALACGWGASVFYWWWQKRLERGPRETAAEHPTLRQARRRLQQACVAGDAAAARQALLVWGQALSAPRVPRDLRELGQYMGAEFDLQLAALNRSLYAPSRQPWDGTQLLDLCRRLEREYARAAVDETALPPLNPPG